MLKKIRISRTHKAKIKKELGLSFTSVDNALNYYTNSDIAQQVRSRAKELLQEEAQNIVIVKPIID